MNRILTTTLTAAAAALLLGAPAPAQVPGTAAARPAPAAAELPPFETAQTDAASWTGRFGPTNCSWFDLGDGVLLLDTGATAADARNLLAEVKRTVPDKPVRWVAMTHFHPDSNDGFAAMLPSDVTLIVNQRAVDELAGVLRGAKGKAPTLVGVNDKLVLRGKAQTIEIFAPATPAHTAFDLWLYTPASGVVYVGDLVTATRCPIASDPGADPKAWLAVLDRIEALHPQAMVATRGPAVTSVSNEILKTRAYLKRVVAILTEMKAKGAPEARVSGELVAKKVGDYCPLPLDTQNALELYRRMTPEGTFPPSKPAKPAAAPAKK
jgi:glyoxylase-like metal-dependent hydrolase (beta-lactamase superfamily II)